MSSCELSNGRVACDCEDDGFSCRGGFRDDEACGAFQVYDGTGPIRKPWDVPGRLYTCRSGLTSDNIVEGPGTLGSGMPNGC